MMVIADDPGTALTMQPHLRGLAGPHHMAYMGYLAAAKRAAHNAATRAAAQEAAAIKRDQAQLDRLSHAAKQTPAVQAKIASLNTQMNVLKSGGTVQQARQQGAAVQKQVHATAAAQAKAAADRKSGKAPRGSAKESQIKGQLMQHLNSLKGQLSCAQTQLAKKKSGQPYSAGACGPAPSGMSGFDDAPSRGLFGLLDDLFGFGKYKRGHPGHPVRMPRGHAYGHYRVMHGLGQAVCPDGSIPDPVSGLCSGGAVGAPGGLVPQTMLPQMPQMPALPQPKGCKPGSNKPQCLLFQLASDAQQEMATVMQQIIALEGQILQVLSQLQTGEPVSGGQPIAPFVDTSAYGMPQPGMPLPYGGGAMPVDPTTGMPMDAGGAPGIPIESVPFGPYGGGGGGIYPMQGGGGDMTSIPAGFDTGGGDFSDVGATTGVPISIDIESGLPPLGQDYGVIQLPQQAMLPQTAIGPAPVAPAPVDQGGFDTTDQNLILAQSFDTGEEQDLGLS